ncbi:tetratricopeptide repeat protein (plasmid) [Bradyrhizobium lupini]|uniref:tetratricopeptide repeat protein n=1 Tax=Rhizobium lupini TaxID=136996 RepID=UPI00366D3C17
MRLALRGRADDRTERRSKIPEWIAAASCGDVDAQLALAWEYARGDAVDADFVTAWKWFDRAASSGQENAVLHRARFLQLRGVPEGIRELRKLAAKGNWRAQFWLGTHYQSEHGRLSQLRAAAWYGRSHKCGFLGGKLAKLAQLRRIAHQPFRTLFAAKVTLEFVSTFMQLFRRDEALETHEMLMYRLKSRSP